MFVIGQKWLNSCKLLYLDRSGCIKTKVVVFGQNGFILANIVVFGQKSF